MRLYHFTLARHALSNIQNRWLKIAEINQLNDPFELLAMNLRDKVQRSAFKTWKKEVNSRYGVLCFCRDWSNTVMWSHYTDRHKGICLGFEIPRGKVQEIAYATGRVQLNTSNTPDESVLKAMLYTKSKDWSYEKEWRVFTRLKSRDPETKLYFHKFDGDLILREVIVGPLCEVTRADLELLVAGYHPPVSLTKARLAFKSFAVVKHKLGLR